MNALDPHPGLLTRLYQQVAFERQIERFGEQDRKKNRRLQGVDMTGGHAGARLISAAWTTTIPVDPPNKFGMDIAGVWDGQPDLSIFKARGGSFVWVKAADGLLLGRYFYENIAHAKALGLVTGCYFWLYKNVRISGTAQANKWWSIVKDLDLDFHCIDFEWTSWNGQPDNPTTSDLIAALDPFEQLSGKPCYIYSAMGYLNQYFNHADRFKTNPFIEAQYEVSAPSAVLPWGPNGHTIWQCSEQWPGDQLGVDPDYARAIDGDIFNGDQAKFDQTFAGNVPNEPPAPVEDAMYEAQSNSSTGRAVRPAHDTNNSAYFYAPASAKLHGSELWTCTANVFATINGVQVMLNRAGDKWLHVTDVDGVACDGWTAIMHMGSTYCRLTTIGDVPPPPSGTRLVKTVSFFEDGTTVECLPRV